MIDFEIPDETKLVRAQVRKITEGLLLHRVSTHDRGKLYGAIEDCRDLKLNIGGEAEP